MLFCSLSSVLVAASKSYIISWKRLSFNKLRDFRLEMISDWDLFLHLPSFSHTIFAVMQSHSNEIVLRANPNLMTICLPKLKYVQFLWWESFNFFTFLQINIRRATDFVVVYTKINMTDTKSFCFVRNL